MAYGIPKISAKQLKQEILNLIAGELDKDIALSGDNLSFYGADIDFRMDLTLVSRGVTLAVIEVKKPVGESVPPQQIAGSDEPGEEAAPVKQVITAAARRQMGRRHVAHEQPKSADKSLESKSQPAKADQPTADADSGSTGKSASSD